MIYSFRCDRIDSEDEYIGESSRKFGERYKEHLKVPSPIFEHQNNTGHITSVENFKIIGREAQSNQRGHVHKSEQSYFEQEYWKVQPAILLG